MNIAFTKKAIAAIVPSEKQFFAKDTRTLGLCLLVSPGGTKTFFLRRRIGGKDERIKLGVFPQLTLEQAQRKIVELNAAINAGANQNEAKRSLRKEPTFGEIFERFIKERRTQRGSPLSARTVEEYRGVLACHLSGLIGRKMSGITSENFRAAHSRVESPGQANKLKAIVSAVFNWARGEGITDKPAPITGVKINFIKPRERYLLPSEIEQFLDALNQSRQKDFFLIALLTGVRRQNLLEMAWREIYFDEAVWRIPKTKNGEAKTIPLGQEVIDILKSRQPDNKAAIPWVFPGIGKTRSGSSNKSHMSMPKRAWSSILKEAKLEQHLRPHDLRRTLGSWQAIHGSSLLIIGKSLGHKTFQATQIYAQLNIDPVRKSIESATVALLEKANK